MSFSPGSVLLVPVAFTDGSATKRRPVLVVHDCGDADILVAPVTSQAARYKSDIAIIHWQQAGLRLPSIVRVEKLATVGKSTVVKPLGKLSNDDWQRAKMALREFFGKILAG